MFILGTKINTVMVSTKLKSTLEALPIKREHALVTTLFASKELWGSSRTSRAALRRLGTMAARNFDFKSVEPQQLHRNQELLNSTTYWHGTGRYQRHGGKVVDVLQGILRGGELRPSLDPFDPDLGMAKTVSFSTKRAYALAYADMHSDKPQALERLLSAQTLANFYVVRTTMAYGYKEAQKHPDGVVAGTKALLEIARERHAQMSQSWKHKTTTRRVNDMFAFGVGSDIPGNYPIVLGFDDQVPTIQTSAAIAATREVRSDHSVGLGHLTHIEVPADHVGEDRAISRAHGLDVPVIAIEDMEQVVARMPIRDILV